MTNTALHTKISNMPISMQNELLDFAEFLSQKKKLDQQKTHPQAGCMKGTFKILANFNEPLDDFKEYMD